MIRNLKELLKSEKKEKEEFLNNLKKNDYLVLTRNTWEFHIMIPVLRKMKRPL